MRHGLLICVPSEAGLFQISIPRDFAAKPPNLRLPAKHEQAQSSFDRGFACAVFSASHGSSHQIVFNLDF
jgi:hypothetical protein